MNKKITLYLLSASLVTLSEGYALFGFGGKGKKDDPKAQVEKMVKEAFPSAPFGSCTKTDGGVNFKIALDHYKNLGKKDKNLAKSFDDVVNKKLDKLKECAKKKNPNFTKALAASCATHKNIIPKEWTRSQALCSMVSEKQGSVEAKNEAIKLMQEDYGSSKFACSKGYGKINWSGATTKFKTLASDKKKKDVFDNYQDITDKHLTALSKCTIEKNKNFAAVLHESCTKDAPNNQWKNAVKLCGKAAKIMEDRGTAADASKQAKIDDKLFPGILAKVGCTKGVAAPFDPAGLADYMKRQADIIGKKGVSAKAKQQATKNAKRVQAYVDRLSKCAVKEGDVNFNKILAEKFADSGKNCRPSESMKKFAKNRTLKKLVFGFYGKNGLCQAVNATKKNIGNSNTVAEAKKALGVPSNRLGWVGFPTKVVAKLGESENFKHLTEWFKLDKKSFDQHFGILLKGVSIGKNGKVANPKSVALLSEGCKEGKLAAFAKKNKMESVVEVCKVAAEAGTEHGRQTTVADAFKVLKVPSSLMAPAAYKICNEAMTEMWKNDDAITAIKTILKNADALPRWQKHIEGISTCISTIDPKTSVTTNPIMTSFIVEAGDKLKKDTNENLVTLVNFAKKVQERYENHLKEVAGVEAAADEDSEANAIEEDDIANMDDVEEAPESYDGEEVEEVVADNEKDADDESLSDEEEPGLSDTEDEVIADEEAVPEDEFDETATEAADVEADADEEAVPEDEFDETATEAAPFEEEADVDEFDETATEAADVEADADDKTEATVDEDDFANMEDVADAPESYDGEDEEDEEAEWLS